MCRPLDADDERVRGVGVELSLPIAELQGPRRPVVLAVDREGSALLRTSVLARSISTQHNHETMPFDDYHFNKFYCTNRKLLSSTDGDHRAPALAPVAPVTRAPADRADFSEEDRTVGDGGLMGGRGGRSDAVRRPRLQVTRLQSQSRPRQRTARVPSSVGRSSSGPPTGLASASSESTRSAAPPARASSRWSRASRCQAKWANSSTHSGRAFDSLPLVGDTASSATS